MNGLNGSFETRISSVEPRIMRDANDTVRRVINVALVFEASDDLAAGIGEAAQDALKHLRSGAQKSANIIFDAVQCKLTFGSGESKRTIDKAVGVRASITKAGTEDATPKIKITLALATKHDELCWLADHLEESLQVKIVASQLELPKTGKAEAA